MCALCVRAWLSVEKFLGRQLNVIKIGLAVAKQVGGRTDAGEDEQRLASGGRKYERLESDGRPDPGRTD